MSQISVAEECPRIARAVIDLGSGSTKLTVAEVELCAKREPNLVKILEDSRSEAIALEAGKNPNGDIPDELQIQTVHAITKLKDEAREIATAAGLSRLELAIAGTHALRTARNRGSFLRRLEREGYSARALTQTQEGRFGF
ncbi:MAG TPA: hypothetical protein PKC28_07515, partial [Bdellovibrionales bacterium]|nr:hypothetical protein [Bdellovibrionales bacterium]